MMQKCFFDIKERGRQTGIQREIFKHRHTLTAHANTPRSDLLYRKGWRPEKGTKEKKNKVRQMTDKLLCG